MIKAQGGIFGWVTSSDHLLASMSAAGASVGGKQ